MTPCWGGLVGSQRVPFHNKFNPLFSCLPHGEMRGKQHHLWPCWVGLILRAFDLITQKISSGSHKFIWGETIGHKPQAAYDSPRPISQETKIEVFHLPELGRAKSQKAAYELLGRK